MKCIEITIQEICECIQNTLVCKMPVKSIRELCVYNHSHNIKLHAWFSIGSMYYKLFKSFSSIHNSIRRKIALQCTIKPHDNAIT